MKRSSWRKGIGDLAERLKGSAWLGRQPPLSILVPLLGLILSLASFQAARSWDWHQRDALFRERATVLAAALDTHLQRVVAIVRAVAQFYTASEQVSARSFERFAEPFLAPGSNIHALEWLPLVREEDRERFEAAARGEGLEDFAIRDLVDGQLRPAEHRPLYFPIHRVAPFGDNALVVGFDPSSEPLRAASMERAAETGAPIASAPVTLLQDAAHQRGLAILAPAYMDSATADPTRGPHPYLRGFAAGVVRMGDLLADVVARLPAQGMDLMLRDEQVLGDAGLIALRSGRDAAGGTAAVAAAFARPGSNFLATLEVAGRTLELHAVPSPGAYPAARWPLVPLLLGLATTAVLTRLVALRHQAVAALRERESRLSLFIEHAPASLAIFDREMRYLAVSERWLSDYGLSGQNLVGRSHYEVFPEIPERWRAVHRRGLAGEVFKATEDRFARGDGSVQWLHWEIRPWRDSRGVVAGIGIFTEDITARKEAESALTQSEERFRLFMDHSPAVASIKDDQGRYVYFNRSYEERFGVRLDDWRGRTDAERWPADLAAGLRASDRAALDSGRPLEITEMLPGADGALRYWQSFKIPFRDARGQTYLGSIGVDVTDRHQAEASLRRQVELQDRLTRVSLSVPGAIFSVLFGPDGHLSMPDVTPAFTELFGLEPREVVEDVAPAARRVHPRDLPRLAASIRRAAARLSLWRHEFRIEHPQKGLLWVEGRCLPRREADGSLLGFGYMQDVTARKQAELELRRFRQIVETSSEVLLFIDRDLRLLVANPAYARLFGTTPERLQGRPLADLVSTDDLAQLEPYLRLALGGEPQRCHLQRHYPVGGLRRMDAELQPFVLDGEVAGVVLSMHDVTESFEIRAALEMHREHLEELVVARTAELQAAEVQARLILDSTADGIYGVDADCRIVFVNPSACRLLGYRIEELVGCEIHEVIHHHRADGSHYSAADCPLVRAIHENRTLRADDELFWTSAGHPIPVSYAAHPMVREGVVVGAVVSFVDMTAYKAVEAAREAALREAERLARVRSEFLANMSHEIRTPLNGVLGLAMVGHRQSAGRKIQETFEQILGSGQHLLGIVNDILDFSKIEAGKLVLDRDQLALGRIIDRALGLVAPRAGGKGLALRVEESPDLPEHCHGDALRLSQVLVNLLANAIKFTEHGEVWLTVGRADDTLVLRVTDTGIGMSEEQLDHLFTPFNQADSSTTRRFGGTGLGLAICHHLVELMGGHIGVTSRLGEGSAFEVHLPLIEPGPPIPPVSGVVGFLGWPADEFARLSGALAARGVSAVAVSEPLQGPDPDLLVVAMPGQSLERLLAIESRGVRLVVADLGGQCELPERLRERVRQWESPLRLRHLVAFLGARDSWVPPLTAAAQAAQRLVGYAVLGAEDNEVNRLVLGQLLEMEGASFTCFEDGLAVLDHLERAGDGAYQILLTDIQMPGLDGYETARRCRRLYPGLPVVGLTAHAMAEERTRCLAAGMVEHVSKPVDMDRLVAVVRQFARRPAATPPSAAVAPPTAPAASVAPVAARPAQEPVVATGVTPLIDLAGLQARYQDRPAFLLRLFGLLRESFSDGPDKLRAAARAGDLGSLVFMAHSIKGVSGNLMAWGVQELARAAEQAAREGRPEAAAQAERLAQGLEELLKVRPEGTRGTGQG